MRLFVRDLAGRSLSVEAGDAEGVKRQIAAAQGIPVDEQRLCFGGRTLVENAQLCNIEGIDEESTLFS